ncbi:NAD-dependent epimerase/dehydratase family protein [Candidatus Poribacteria bacterium]|jgi:nucleoside-diphosphate-sugar epimerase|nr:NAD-dependent epimerase/dehydratase family protein [Candidatus Poribacteria bacterium]MBT5712619.1 NAD-dependent epimerase/dehydratase family protein [Candidatus Poribacteria bacterium]MBT7804428.1 NAD-dependent epimerase/dehydratase family protein [Candidatus Poribacteria bacterium]
MMQGRRIVITGGGGFIGVSLAKRLADTNDVVLCDLEFTRNAYAYASLDGHPNVQRVEADILDGDALKRVCSGAAIVIHLAAVVGVQQVLMNTSRTLEVNIRGTQQVLDAIEPKDVERFVYLSTSEVYGSHAYDAVETAPTPVGPSEDPRWCYAASKVAGEHLVQSCHRERGLPTVILRPFNVFGPGRIGDHAILRFIFQALNAEPLTVHNEGAAIRAWCYIDDFVDGVLRSLTRDEAVGETFNIGAPRNTVTMYQLASDIVETCNSRSGIAFTPIKHSDVHLRAPNVSKARDLLGYEPRVPLAEGLRVTADWYREAAHLISPAFMTA